MESLGTKKRKYIFTCLGVLPPQRLHNFALEFIKLAGMTPARPGRVDHYPYNGGGGQGYTGFFPLMESYLVVDAYTDMAETEILLSTCVPERINLSRLINFLECQVGDLKKPPTVVNELTDKLVEREVLL